MISKKDFQLLYLRFHFHIDKDKDWDKLKVTEWVKNVDIIEWESGKLYDELVRLNALK
jgi:hypothetical protein